MKSKFFSNNYKKIAIVAMLSSLIAVPNFEVDIEAAVAKDLTIYSGGGGGGTHQGASFFGSNGSDGSSLVINGDDAEILGTIEDLSNPLIYQLSGYSGQYSRLNHFSPFSQELIQLSALHSLSGGGGVDGYNGKVVPSGLRLSRSVYGNYVSIIDQEEDVANFRVVSGDGGQLANPDFYRQFLEDIFATAPNYIYDNTVNGMWNNNPDDIVKPASNGVTLDHNLGKINLYNTAFIKSGSIGSDIPNKETALPHPTLGTKIVGLPDRAKGGIILLDIDTLQLMDNNRLDIIKDSADVEVVISSLLMTSNGNVVLDNMRNVGSSKFLVRNFDFTGGTFSYDLLTNDSVDLTGSTLNVRSRDLSNDDVYDLLKSDDYFSGTVNVSDATGEVLEYRLISDTGTTVLAPTTTSIDLVNYSNVHTIQAVFGYRADFISNGGTNVLPQTSILLSELVSEPVSPTRGGYLFEGWFVDQNLSTRYEFNTPVVNDVTLYAKWSRIPLNFNLNFESNGGNLVPTQIIVEGNKGIEPSDPKRAQSTFIGWYTDQTFSQLYDFETILTTDITVYAKWEPVVQNPEPNKPDQVVPSPEPELPNDNSPKPKNEIKLPSTGMANQAVLISAVLIIYGLSLLVFNSSKSKK